MATAMQKSEANNTLCFGFYFSQAAQFAKSSFTGQRGNVEAYSFSSKSFQNFL